jgi:hypothetical protein
MTPDTSLDSSLLGGVLFLQRLTKRLLTREGVIFWPSVLRRGARVAATQAKHFVIYVLD